MAKLPTELAMSSGCCADRVVIPPLLGLFLGRDGEGSNLTTVERRLPVIITSSPEALLLLDPFFADITFAASW